MIFTCAPENEKRDGVDYRDVKAWFQQCRDYKIDVDRQLDYAEPFRYAYCVRKRRQNR